MLEIDIDPDVVGSLAWHGVFAALGVATAYFIVVRRARHLNIDTKIISAIAMWAILGGIVGARLVSVIDNWDSFSDDPIDIIIPWRGGVALFGALLGGTITGVAYAWIKGYPVGRVADITAAAMLIAQAIGRVGDVINGEHFSKTTDLSWSWVHTHLQWVGLRTGRPAIPLDEGGSEIGYHPSVGYEMVMDVFLLFFIWHLVGRIRPHGMAMLI